MTEGKNKARRPHGAGSVYLRDGSKLYVMAYYDPAVGKLVRVSTGETSIKRAKGKLDQRLAEIRTGKYLGPAAEHVEVGELAEDVLRDYEVQGHRDTINPKIRWEKHLRPFFAHRKASEINRPLIDKYVAARKKAKASNASINRELAFLKRCFRLGLEHEKVYRVPTFPHLTEENVREGFPTDAEFTKLKEACAKEGLWLRAMLEIASKFGWRKRSLLAMRVQNVDLLRGTIRQEGSFTKSGEGNEVPMPPEMKTLVTACVTGKEPQNFLFTRDEEGLRQIVDFRISWARATKAAGVPDLHFHDLCRKAARDLDSAGVSQIVGMQVMGRKTPSIYKRYRIVDTRDVARAIDKLVEHENSQQKIDEEINSEINSQIDSQLAVHHA
jgi:integrase